MHFGFQYFGLFPGAAAQYFVLINYLHQLCTIIMYTYPSVDWFVALCVEMVDDVKDVQVLDSPA